MLAVFYCLLEIDIPLARFLRSVHVEWLDQANRVGNRLGSGVVLAAISGTLLMLGGIGGWVRLRQAGLQGLIAHAAAGLTVQALKHLIGRPRPRFLHASGFQLGPLWGPSLETGLDSFPSGHTAAALAVAIVMARRFPAAAKPFYAAAGFVAVTRILSGSHFPTDVLAGAMVGMLAGHVASRPLREWRLSVQEALRSLAISVVAIFAFLWAMVQSPSDGWFETTLFVSGLITATAGLSIRLYRSLSPSVLTPYALRLTAYAPDVLIAVGLALTTGSLVVTAVVAMVSVAAGLASTRETSGVSRETTNTNLSRELLYAAGVAVTVLLIQGARGVLPL
jgi:undecaprenyl-diphosphatase